MKKYIKTFSQFLNESISNNLIPKDPNGPRDNNGNLIWKPEEINTFEKEYGGKFTLKPSGYYDVKGDICISWVSNDWNRKDLECFIPPIDVLDGDLDCNNTTELFTLIGCPRVITGDLDASENHLQDLDGIGKVYGELNLLRNFGLSFDLEEIKSITGTNDIAYDNRQLIGYDSNNDDNEYDDDDYYGPGADNF